MASIDQIEALLDRKLDAALDRTLEDVLDRKLDAALDRTLEAVLDRKLAPLQAALGSLQDTVRSLESSAGSLVESDMRKEAKNMFGASFVKPFLIRSLHDAVHLVSEAKFQKSTPDAVDERLKAADLLAAEAEKFAIPLAKAFLLSFDANGYGDTTLAKKAFDENDFCKGLNILIGEAKKNVAFFLKLLKKAFSAEKKEGVLKPELLTPDGPGVMLLELSSKYTTTALEIESDIFRKGDLRGQIENDLRGKIDLVGRHAKITCGDVKSAVAAVSAGKQQLIVRTRFLKTVVDTMMDRVGKGNAHHPAMTRRHCRTTSFLGPHYRTQGHRR